MRTFLTWLALVTSCGAPTAARAAEPAVPTDGLAKVAPYVDDSTRVVISVDLSRIDVAVLLRMLVPSLPDGTSVGADLQRSREALLAAKIKDVYVVVSLAELPQQPWFLLAPSPPDLEPAALFAQLPRKWPVWLGRAEAQTVRRIDRDDTGPMLFIGLEETLKRLTHAPFPSRPELAASWRAVDGAPIRILFLPTDDDRRVVEELFPTLPDRFGSGPSTVLTRGLRWAACGIDVTPKRSLQLIAESADPPAAQALQRDWTKLLAGLVLPSGPARVASQPTGSQFAGQIERLVPHVDGQRLVLTLDQPGKGLAALEDFLTTPPVAQMVIGHYVTEQLQQLAFAMHNLHDTNKQFPAQANYDASGRALLSWRVHLLPFLGDEAASLYRRFRLDEPWDSEHNRSLIPEMPQVYALPRLAGGAGSTHLLRPTRGRIDVVSGPRADCFPRHHRRHEQYGHDRRSGRQTCRRVDEARGLDVRPGRSGERSRRPRPWHLVVRLLRRGPARPGGEFRRP